MVNCPRDAGTTDTCKGCYHYDNCESERKEDSKIDESKVAHLKCACGKEVTRLVYDKFGDAEVEQLDHFDLIRTKKMLRLDGDDKDGYDVEEDREDGSVKTQIFLCLDCMDKMCQESPTFRALFWDEKRQKILY